MVFEAGFLADVETPISLFCKISQAEPMAFLLESNEDDTRLARYSFIGVAPLKTVRFQNGEVVIQHSHGHTETAKFTNPLHVLQDLMAQQPPAEATGMDIPFLGGLVGYMGYGATHYFDNIPRQAGNALDVPDGYYGLYDSIIVFDHLYRRFSFISHRPEAQARALWERLQASFATAPALTPLAYHAQDLPDETIFDGITGPFTQQGFCDTVRQAKDYIKEGQVFQIVVAQRFSMPVSAPPIDVYRMVRAVNPSPYSYFLKFPGFTYLGASPETFARSHQGQVEIRVLAGTRPRGLSDEADRQLESELVKDEKELAEHYMLVDLGRNDLGRMCEPGSVEVGQIATLTRYTHVMHLATRLTGKLRADRTAYDVFQSCFPRGTVSGAPKIRAMELLSQLEPEQRGIYAGAVGYFDFGGNMDSAIAIRSVLIKDGHAHVQAGAGVVYDSDPLAEYHETRNKAKSMLKAVKLAERMTTPCP